MLSFCCRDVRPRLTAYCDGELPVAEQVSVRSHLIACPGCASEADALAALGAALRRASLDRIELFSDDMGSLRTGVLARLQAERSEAMPRRLRGLFDDLHLVWAVSGAAVATLVCLAAVLGLIRVSLREVPQSMAAVIGALADPGSNQNPVSVDGRMALPTVYPGDLMAATPADADEALLTLAAVVTREGEVRNLALLDQEVGGKRSGQQRAIMELLDAAAQTRFQPARAGGAPVAVNVVWLLAHTTVVAKSDTEELLRIGHSWRRLRPTPAVLPAGVPVSEAVPERPRPA